MTFLDPRVKEFNQISPHKRLGVYKILENEISKQKSLGAAADPGQANSNMKPGNLRCLTGINVQWYFFLF